MTTAIQRLLLCLLLLNCDEPPEPPPVPTPAALVEAARNTAALEAATNCTDTWFNLANTSSVAEMACPRADQRLTFEADVDKDAYGVCRCVREPAPCYASAEVEALKLENRAWRRLANVPYDGGGGHDGE